jgi:cell division protein FtsL
VRKLGAAVVADPCPFLGLRPFDSADSRWFYGRDEQIDELLRRLGRARFLAVVGTSGSGKSSLVRAGLVPSLCRGYMPASSARWRVAIMRPGGDPFDSLARALAADDILGPDSERPATLRRSSLGLVAAVRGRLPETESLLLVVDQFEEIFRFKKEAQDAEDEADAFIQLLLAASEQAEVKIYVVLTMRSDYLGDCALFRGLPEALNGAQYLVPVMTRSQLGEAIEGPVTSRSVDIAPELLQRLLNDVGHGLEQELDQLPVLQHVLMRTWQRASGSPALELQHYRDAGGMAGALNQHADEILSSLSQQQRDIARQMFKCLTEEQSLGRDIRRPTSFGELRAVIGVAAEPLKQVIEKFRPFLWAPPLADITDQSVIDITHEAIIRQWKLLRGWAHEEAYGAKFYQRLAFDAGRHARPWDDAELLEALRLKARDNWSESWARRYSDGSCDFATVDGFLTKSRRYRTLRRLQKVLLIAAVILVPAFFFFQYQVGQARSKRLNNQIKLLQSQIHDQEASLQDAQEQLARAKTSEVELRRLAEQAERQGQSALAADLEKQAVVYQDQVEQRSSRAISLKRSKARIESEINILKQESAKSP